MPSAAGKAAEGIPIAHDPSSSPRAGKTRNNLRKVPATQQPFNNVPFKILTYTRVNPKSDENAKFLKSRLDYYRHRSFPFRRLMAASSVGTASATSRSVSAAYAGKERNHTAHSFLSTVLRTQSTQSAKRTIVLLLLARKQKTGTTKSQAKMGRTTQHASLTKKAKLQE